VFKDEVERKCLLQSAIGFTMRLEGKLLIDATFLRRRLRSSCHDRQSLGRFEEGSSLWRFLLEFEDKVRTVLKITAFFVLK